MLDQLEFMATQHDTTEIEAKQSIKCYVARNFIAPCLVRTQ